MQYDEETGNRKILKRTDMGLQKGMIGAKECILSYSLSTDRNRRMEAACLIIEFEATRNSVDLGPI